MKYFFLLFLYWLASIYPAKKGYILLAEKFKKTKQRKETYTELRLERIN